MGKDKKKIDSELDEYFQDGGDRDGDASLIKEALRNKLKFIDTGEYEILEKALKSLKVLLTSKSVYSFHGKYNIVKKYDLDFEDMFATLENEGFDIHNMTAFTFFNRLSYIKRKYERK